MVLFSVLECLIDIVSINVIKATIVIHKVNMISKSNFLKPNLIACHVACEQAHLWVGYRWQRSWREEWGEEK